MNVTTGEPITTGGGGGTADFTDGGTIPIGGPGNTADAAMSFQTGTDIWTHGIDASDTPAGDRPYKIARGGAFGAVGTTDVVEISETGQLTLPFYNTAGHHLRVDATGLVTSEAPGGGGGGDVTMTVDNAQTGRIALSDGATGKVITTAYTANAPTINITTGDATFLGAVSGAPMKSVSTQGVISTLSETVAPGNGQNVGLVNMRSFDGTTNSVVSSIISQATEAHTVGAHATNMRFVTTDAAQVFTSRVEIDGNGNTNLGGLLRFQNIGAEPTTNLVKGMVYYDDTDDVLKVYNGTLWLDIQAFAATPVLVVSGGAQNLVVGQRSATFTATPSLFAPGALTYAWTSTDTGAFFSNVTGQTTDVEFSQVGNWTVSCTATHVNTTNATDASDANTITAAPTVQGIFDTGLTTAFNQANFGAILSLRKSRDAGFFCCQIIKTAGTLTNIGWDSDGYVSRTQVEAASGTGDVRVQIWYDQSGNARNATAPAATNRPTLVFGTTPFLPEMTFSPSGNPVFLTIPGTVTDLKLDSTTQEATFVAKHTSATPPNPAQGLLGTNRTWELRTSDVQAADGQFETTQSTVMNGYALPTTHDITSTAMFLTSVGMTNTPSDDRFSSFDGSATVTLNNKVDKLPLSTGTGSPGLRVGSRDTGLTTHSWDGSIYEVFITDYLIAPVDRVLLKTRYETHFELRGSYPDIPAGSFTPTDLATTNAYCMCSLRKLRSAYVGNCCIIQGDVGTTPAAAIGFDVATGMLDKTAFDAHLATDGSTQGFIEQIYDQSGNNNHFTQTTTSEQPEVIFRVADDIPEIHWDATSHFDNAGPFYPTSTSHHLRTIIKTNGPGSPRFIISYTAGDPTALEYHLGGVPTVQTLISNGFAHGVTTPAFNLNVYHPLTGVCTSGVDGFYVRQSGVESTKQTGTLEPTASSYRWGLRNNASLPFGGLGVNICNEMLIYNGATVPDGDYTLLESDQNNVWVNGLLPIL